MAELGIPDEAGLNAVPRTTNLDRMMSLGASHDLTPSLSHGAGDLHRDPADI
jgi:hypothetical protein